MADDDYRPPWLRVAMGLIGTHEVPGPGDNPKIVGWARELGGSIAREYKHDEIAWCALFMNYILFKAGLFGTGSLWALDFASWGKSLGAPAVGAIAPMHRTGGGGHVVCVVGRDQHGNLMGIGGNQSDAVSIKPFPRARPVGFRWPSGWPLPLPQNVGFFNLPIVASDGRISEREA